MELNFEAHWKEADRLVTERTADVLDPLGVPWRFEVRTGEPAAELEALAAERGADMIVAGRPRAKAAGRTAAEVMSAPVITIDPDATVPMAAKLLARHGIKRLPVVDDQGRLVGIVSRADLLRLFLRDDEAIRREILEQVLLHGLWIDPLTVTVTVQDGIVTLAGRLERKSLIPMAVRLTRRVPGVVDVVSQLSFDWDDDRPAPARVRSWVP